MSFQLNKTYYDTRGRSWRVIRINHGEHNTSLVLRRLLFIKRIAVQHNMDDFADILAKGTTTEVLVEA